MSRQGTLAQEIHGVAHYLVRGGRAIALTGAGISVDSGIPDFRSAHGLWSRYEPMEYATIDAFRLHPRKVWDMLFELHDTVGDAAPNAGHAALAELEEMGLLDAVITQNIDDLHQRAGSQDVVEFHGSTAWLRCPDCDERYRSADKPIAPPEPPLCDRCGAVLKPDFIFFGEMIPSDALNRSMKLAAGCRLMLVVGTSALVAPASQLPALAMQAGAAIVEANLEETALSRMCLHRLEGPAAETLPMLVEACRSLMSGEKP